MSKIRDYQEKAKDDVDERPTHSNPKVNAKNPQPLSSSSEKIIPHPTEDSSGFLVHFLSVTYFFDLFEYIATHLFREKTNQASVMKLRSFYPKIFLLCFGMDLIIRAAVVASLFMSAVWAATKILR